MATLATVSMSVHTVIMTRGMDAKLIAAAGGGVERARVGPNVPVKLSGTGVEDDVPDTRSDGPEDGPAVDDEPAV